MDRKPRNTWLESRCSRTSSDGYETFTKQQVEDKYELSPRSKAAIDQKIRSA